MTPIGIYAGDEADYCSAAAGPLRGGYHCTAEPRHAGDHAAYGIGGEGPYLTWPKSPELLDSMRGVKLCPWCQDRHFRPYPEQAASSCNQIRCQCWCTQGTGQ